MDGEGTVMVLKRRRDARDRRPLIATMHGDVDTAGPETRAGGPVQKQSLYMHTKAGLSMAEDSKVIIRLKHKRDPRDRIPLVPSKKDLEQGSESA